MARPDPQGSGKPRSGVSPRTDSPGVAGVYSIGAVAARLGVPTATVRTWEERYGVISPQRTQGGHRMYSRAQVQQLRSVMADMAAGSSAADAHRSLAARLLAMDTEAPAPAPEAAGRPGVLVVEREQYSAQLIEYCLRPEGFEVQIALDLLEARRRFLATHADLVIVALLMDGGEQFCRWLKDEGAGAVLGVSALDAPDRAIRAGADAFLCKPFSPPQLTAVVDGLVGVIANAEVRG